MASEEIALTEFPLECKVDVNFHAADVADNLTRQQVLKFIKELDEEMGSWPLTLLLAEYFSDEVEKARREEGLRHIVALSSEELLNRIVEADKKDALEVVPNAG